MIRHTRRPAASSLLLSVCFLASAVVAQGAPRLIVFGDSLSDPGNFFAETRQAVVAPYAPIPDAPYAIGGHHFSNGRTWIEQLAARSGRADDARPAVVSPTRFTNYAFGRARARPAAPAFPDFDLGSQVDRFLTDFGGAAPADATYVVWIGTNDARDALALGGDPVIVTDAVTAIVTNLTRLQMHGARRIVVLNVPDLGLIPAVNQQPAPVPALASGFTLAFNQALGFGLDLVAAGLTPVGGELRRVDTFAILGAIVSDPAAHDLTDVTDACLVFGVQGHFLAGSPSQFLFWDGGHPTTAGHAALCRSVEPLLGTW